MPDDLRVNCHARDAVCHSGAAESPTYNQGPLGMQGFEVAAECAPMWPEISEKQPVRCLRRGCPEIHELLPQEGKQCRK